MLLRRAALPVRGRAIALAAVVAIAFSVGLPAALPSNRGRIALPPSPRARPDIILVTIDALRADHVSRYGYGRLTSPLIDAFSRGAVVFTDAIAQAPYTKASVASLMTGLYPSTHKTVSASVPFPETMTGHLTSVPITTDVLPPNVTTLAQAFQAAGYHTLGFTANPFLIDAFGFSRGFDTFEFFPGPDFASADHVVGPALKQVEAIDRRPMCLWVHVMEPHSPYTPPEWAKGTFPLGGGPPEPIASTVAIPEWLLPGSPRDRRVYVASYDEEIAAADVAVDRLLRQLHDVRGVDNTVTVLTSDHGEQFLDHGGWEHSTTLYEELIRVPLIIKAPHPSPRTVKAQVQLIDLFPTLLEYAGIAVPEAIAGRSLSAALHGVDESRPAFSEIAGSQYAVRVDGWKLIVSSDGSRQLFDLGEDPHEQHDVAARQTARSDELERLLYRNLAASLKRGRSISATTMPVAPNVLQRLGAVGYFGR
ncbi:MAG TPA: sulfatase [Vicinamibacterales bacterium]